jgi:hypothetical protein
LLRVGQTTVSTETQARRALARRNGKAQYLVLERGPKRRGVLLK